MIVKIPNGLTSVLTLLTLVLQKNNLNFPFLANPLL